MLRSVKYLIIDNHFPFFQSNLTKLGFLMLVWMGILNQPTLTWSEPQTTLTITPNSTLNQLDERIYSHFLEHIYHSVHGGLWGELIWNRSFEETAKIGFSPLENKVELRPQEPYNRLLLGELDWQDYELTLEARKKTGKEGFLILFRSPQRQASYRLKLGGWLNTKHFLEKQESPFQNQPLASCPGHITPNKWYRLRIRCEGAKLQCWLNDDLIFNYTDRDQPYLSGKIGLAVTNCITEFRNPQVVALDGTNLLNRLAPVLPRYWYSTGQGEVCLDNNAINCENSLRLRGPDATIQQTPLNVVAHETYQGSLWVRGISRANLAVRLINGPLLWAEQYIPLNSSEWQKILFTLQCKGSSPSATLEIKLTDRGTAWIDQISLVSESALHTGGFNPNLLRILAELNPPMLRWPGGLFVTHYRWKDAIGPQDQRRVYPVFTWDDLDTNAFGIDEFLQLCQKLGCEPIIVVNSHPSRDASAEEVDALLQDTLDLIQYCNGPAHTTWGAIRSQNGHPAPYQVKYWELDDMVTHGNLERAQQWAQAMKTAAPDIHLLADAYFGTTPNIQERNLQALNALGEWIDYISIEHYTSQDDFRTAIPHWDLYFNQTRKLIAQSPNPHIKIYVSEWNLYSDNWRSGLYAASLLNTFERHSDLVKIASPAILMCHSSGRGNHTLIRFDQSQWYPSPCFIALKLWHDFYAPTRLAISQTGVQSPLDAVASLSSDQQWIYVKLVNPSEKTIPLALKIQETAPLRQAQIWTIKGNLTQSNSLIKPNAITPIFHPIDVTDGDVKITLSAYSANIIGLQRSKIQKDR